MIRNKMQGSEHDLFSEIRKNLFGAVRGVLLLCAFVSTTQVRAQIPTIHQDAVIGVGQTFLWRCNQLTAGGPQEEVLKKFNSDVDSIRYTLNLEVLGATDAPAENLLICAGDTLLWRCQLAYADGDYTDEVKYVRYPQIDSIRYAMHLSLVTPSIVPVSETIDEGDTLLWHCLRVYESGVYDDTVYGGTPYCAETIFRLTLTVVPRPVEVKPAVDATIESGQTFLWRCMQLTAANTYHDTVKYAGSNADSVRYTLNLTVLDRPTEDKPAVDATIELGQTFLWRCMQLTAANTYHDTVKYAGSNTDSVRYTLNLTILDRPVEEKPAEEATICESQTFLWRCMQLTEANTYHDTVKYAGSNADSVRYTLHLQVNVAALAEPENVTIYEGDTLIWRCLQVYKTGTYFDTVFSANGVCPETIYQLNLTVVPHADPIEINEELAICKGDTVLWRCMLLANDGIYGDTVRYAPNYDSARYTLHLTVRNPIVMPNDQVLINKGDSTLWHGQYYKNAGEYTLTEQYTTAPYCDSVTYRLRVVTYDSIVYYACGPDTLLWRCNLVSQECHLKETVHYTHSQFTDAHVDSAYYVLQFKSYPDATRDTIHVVINALDTPYVWNEHQYTATGLYSDSIFGQYQECPDVIHNLDLIVVKYDSTTFHSCFNDTLLWRCMLVGEDGIYKDTLRGTNRYTGEEVDSIYYVLNFSRFEAPEEVVIDSVISQDQLPFTWRDTTITSVGTYELHDTIYHPNSECADTTFTLNLTVEPIDTIERFDTLCYGDTLLWHCMLLDSTDIYYDAEQYISGNDSARYVLHLTVQKPVAIRLTVDTLCNGDSLQWVDGKWYKQSIDTMFWTYYPLTMSQQAIGYEHGCDSVQYQLKLVAREVLDSVLTDTVCYAPVYQWRNKNWDIPTSDIGDLTYTFYDTAHYIGTTNCDSVRYTMKVTVLRATSLTTDTTVCEQNLAGFRWKPFKSEPIEYAGFTGDSVMIVKAFHKPIGEQTEGCDSVIHTLRLHVQKVLPDTIYTDTTICHNEQFIWYGETYSATGRYEHTILWPETNCDSAYCALRLVVRNLPDTVEDNPLTVCAGSYVQWRGKWIGDAGEHVDTVRYFGTECDSVYHKVNLIVLEPTYADTVHAKFCQGGSYTWRGKSYTEEGDYQDTLRYNMPEPCDSVIFTLHLTTLVPKDSAETHYICNGESYLWFGTYYSQTGTYTHTDTAVNGCDSILYTLYLEKQAPMSQQKDTLYICGTGQVVWNFNHIAYDHAGLYYDTIRTQQGCDSVAGELLVEEQQATTALPDSATIYESELYPWHGDVYGEAGDYETLDKYASGCDSVYYSLHLTVLPVVRNETYITDTVCRGTEYMNTGHTINAYTEWTDSVRRRDNTNALVDYITHYAIDVYAFDFPDAVLESAEIACGQAPKITAVVQALEDYIYSSTSFAPNCQLSWFISENNGIWQPLDTMQALNGNDSIVAIRCVLNSDCGTISKETSFKVGTKVYPETFTEYDFLPVIKKFEGTMLMLDVNDVCARFGWINCAPQLSTDAGYISNGLYPDQVRWYKQVGQLDNLSHPDPTDPSDVNMHTYGYYYSPTTNDSYYAIIEHELTVSVSDCEAWARTVAISGGSSTLGDLQPNVVNGAQHPTVIVRGVSSCDITVTNSMGSVVISLQNASGSFTAPVTPGTYFVVIRDLVSGIVYNRTLLVY